MAKRTYNPLDKAVLKSSGAAATLMATMQSERKMFRFDSVDAAAVFAIAVADSDVIERQRAIVHDAAGGVVAAVIAAADSADAMKGEAGSYGHDDDATVGSGATEVALQGAPVEVDVNRFAGRDGDVRR